jgi:copper(I)-binding protein
VSRRHAAQSLGRARTVALLLAVAVLPLAAGCSAGQVAATANDTPAVEGAVAYRGGLTLADVRIASPPTGSYLPGDDAALYGGIGANEETSDTLVRITTDVAAGATLVHVLGGGISASAGATASGLPGASSPAPSRPASPAAGASAPPASASPATPAAQDLDVAIGSSRLIVFKEGSDFLQLVGLTRTLIPGMTVTVTFSFAQAGDVTLEVPVATPDTPEPRPTPSPPLVE